MKKWKRWIVKWLGIKQEIFKGNLDTERALREKNRRILELEQENAGLKSKLWHPKLVHVEIDPALKAQAQAQIGCYEKPEKQTDKPRVIPSPRGQHFMAHRHDPEFQKTQHELPKMPHNPLSITRLEPMNSAEWML